MSVGVPFHFFKKKSFTVQSSLYNIFGPMRRSELANLHLFRCHSRKGFVVGNFFSFSPGGLFALSPEALGADGPEESMRRIPLELQRLFARMLIADETAVSTEQLTRSFGWTGDEVSSLMLCLNITWGMCYFRT